MPGFDDNHPKAYYEYEMARDLEKRSLKGVPRGILHQQTKSGNNQIPIAYLHRFIPSYGPTDPF